MSSDGLILKAAKTAAELHKDHLRKYSNNPYIFHPMRVAGRVTLLEGAGPVEIASAWLHDTLEMCSIKEHDLREMGFPTVVIDNVVGLSNISRFMSKDVKRWDRKKADFEFLAKQPHWVKMIKLLDRIDNLAGLSFKDCDWMGTYCLESKDLLKAIGEEDTILAAEAEDIIDYYEKEIVRLETAQGWDGL